MKFADQTGLPQMMGTRSCGYGWAAPCFPDSYYGVDYAAICRLRYSS